MRVLVADGDPTFLENLRTDFHMQQDVECRTVSSGLQCLNSLREFRPDILILHHSLLWGGSGGVLAVMQDDPELAQIPVIIVTDDPTEERNQDTNLNVIAQLQKPIRYCDILALLQDRASEIAVLKPVVV